MCACMNVYVCTHARACECVCASASCVHERSVTFMLMYEITTILMFNPILFL